MNLFIPLRSLRFFVVDICPNLAWLDLEPDFIIDWRDYFVGEANKKGHQLADPAAWNTKLLPQLYDLESQINQRTDCRLIRARGLARLSTWFAFGFAFSDVARYKIEVAQNDRLWRTDAAPSEDFRLITSNGMDMRDGEIFDGSGNTVAVALSVSGSLDDDVRHFVSNEGSRYSAMSPAVAKPHEYRLKPAYPAKTCARSMVSKDQ